MESIKNIHLLTTCDIADEALPFLGILKTAHIPIQPKQAKNPEELRILCSQSWDICLALEKSKLIPAMETLRIIKEYEKDLPTIIISEHNDLTIREQLLDAGAFAVTSKDKPNNFPILIKKAMRDLENRRKIKKLEKSIRENDLLIKNLIEFANTPIALIDYAGNPKFFNSSFKALFDIDTNNENIFSLIDKDNITSFKYSLTNFINQEHKIDSTHCICRKRKTNHKIEIEFSLQKIFYGNTNCIQLIVNTNKNLSFNRLTIASEQEIDLITGLNSKNALLNKIENKILETAENGQHCYLLYIDIVNFNKIKQEQGLSACDLFISDLAQIINNFKANFIARFAEDVIAIIVDNPDAAKVLEYAKKIRQKLITKEINFYDTNLKADIRIGIVPITEVSTNSQEIMARGYVTALQTNAEIQIASFNTDGKHHEELLNKVLANNIQKSLANGEFQLRYQPIINIHFEHKEIYEVLVRIADGDGNYIEPANFLPAAFHIGILDKIDRWIILHAAKILADHRLHGHNSFLFIIISAATLQDQTIIPWISSVFKTVRLPSDAIIFEISEPIAAANIKAAKRFVASLKSIHGKCALSNYGSGFNSRKTLKNLDVDYVKLDGIYTIEVARNLKGAQQKFADTIKEIHAQGKLAIATMVESANTLPKLWNSGVNYLQGYYLSPPNPTMEFDFSFETTELINKEE